MNIKVLTAFLFIFTAGHLLANPEDTINKIFEQYIHQAPKYGEVEEKEIGAAAEKTIHLILNLAHDVTPHYWDIFKARIEGKGKQPSHYYKFLQAFAPKMCKKAHQPPIYTASLPFHQEVVSLLYKKGSDATANKPLIEWLIEKISKNPVQEKDVVNTLFIVNLIEIIGKLPINNTAQSVFDYRPNFKISLESLKGSLQKKYPDLYALNNFLYTASKISLQLNFESNHDAYEHALAFFEWRSSLAKQIGNISFTNFKHEELIKSAEKACEQQASSLQQALQNSQTLRGHLQRNAQRQTPSQGRCVYHQIEQIVARDQKKNPADVYSMIHALIILITNTVFDYDEIPTHWAILSEHVSAALKMNDFTPLIPAQDTIPGKSLITQKLEAISKKIAANKHSSSSYGSFSELSSLLFNLYTASFEVEELTKYVKSHQSRMISLGLNHQVATMIAKTEKRAEDFFKKDGNKALTFSSFHPPLLSPFHQKAFDRLEDFLNKFKPQPSKQPTPPLQEFSPPSTETPTPNNSPTENPFPLPSSSSPMTENEQTFTSAPQQNTLVNSTDCSNDIHTQPSNSQQAPLPQASHPSVNTPSVTDNPTHSPLPLPNFSSPSSKKDQTSQQTMTFNPYLLGGVSIVALATTAKFLWGYLKNKRAEEKKHLKKMIFLLKNYYSRYVLNEIEHNEYLTLKEKCMEKYSLKDRKYIEVLVES